MKSSNCELQAVKMGTHQLIAHYGGKSYSMRYESDDGRFELNTEDVDFFNRVQVTSSLGSSANANVIRID